VDFVTPIIRCSKKMAKKGDLSLNPKVLSSTVVKVFICQQENLHIDLRESKNQTLLNGGPVS
jgi:hypothetical protein